MHKSTRSHPNLILFIALMIIPLSGVGTDLYAPSMPAIAQDLGISASLVKLTMSIYLLGFSIGQIPFGAFSDVFGRKYVVFIAITLFMLISLVAPFTKSIAALLAIRFIQGFAAAGPSTIAKSLCSDTFSGAALRKAVTYFNMSWGLGPVIAPIIGGYLQHYYGWHASFYFLTIYSFVLAFIVLTALRETLLHPTKLNLRTIYQNYRRILSHPVFIAGSVCLGAGYAFIISFGVIGSFLIQSDLGYNAITFGHTAFIIAFALLAGNLSNRALITKLKANNIIKASLILSLLSSGIMLILAYTIPMNLYTVVAPVAVIAFTLGMTHPNITAELLIIFPKMGGIAASAMGCLFLLITSIATAIASYTKSQTQIPMSWYYFALSFLYFVAYFFYLRKHIREC